MPRKGTVVEGATEMYLNHPRDEESENGSQRGTSSHLNGARLERKA